MQYRVTIDKTNHGERLDLALVACQLGLSRRKIRTAIDVGGVFVNKKRVRIASRKVFAGDQIVMTISEESRRLEKSDVSLLEQDVLFLDHEMMVINKPAGIAVQATQSQSVFHIEALANDYLGRLGVGFEKSRVSLVHRLDRETSGVLVLALTKRRARILDEAFKQREVSKVYLALSHGVPREKTFQCELPLAPPDKHFDVRVDTKSGKPASTAFRLVEVFDECSLIEARPKSGRTHQIRVHLEALGLPIVGDKKYGERQPTNKDLASKYHLLHAHALSFKLEDEGTEHRFVAPLPMHFQSVLDAIRDAPGD